MKHNFERLESKLRMTLADHKAQLSCKDTDIDEMRKKLEASTSAFKQLSQTSPDQAARQAIDELRAAHTQLRRDYAIAIDDNQELQSRLWSRANEDEFLKSGEQMDHCQSQDLLRQLHQSEAEKIDLRREVASMKIEVFKARWSNDPDHALADTSGIGKYINDLRAEYNDFKSRTERDKKLNKEFVEKALTTEGQLRDLAYKIWVWVLLLEDEFGHLGLPVGTHKVRAKLEGMVVSWIGPQLEEGGFLEPQVTPVQQISQADQVHQAPPVNPAPPTNQVPLVNQPLPANAYQPRPL